MYYIPHELQLEEEQPEQELPVPAMGLEMPEALSLLKEAKRDRLLFAIFLHFGQLASLSDSDMERMTSNFLLQL